MRDEKEERKKQARANKHKAKQHSTPKAVTFPRKNELPQVGLEPTTHVHVHVCTIVLCCEPKDSNVITKYLVTCICI